VLARLQQFISIGLVIGASGWAACLVAAGQPVWAWAGASLIVFGYALFLGAEFVLLHFVQTTDVAPRPQIRQLLSAWWNEVITAPRVFLWRQPFRSNAESDNFPERPDGRRGVLFIHGFVCNRGLWNPWMRELRSRRIPFAAINLEPVFGSIDHYADVIETAARRLEVATGLPIVLVGHSMGGIAIRAWCARFNAGARVHRVITIGSPHQGTWLARFGASVNGREMRLDNPWLVKLASGETAEHYNRFTCFFGHCDNIVFPAASGMLPGAQNIHVPATAHVHMAFKPQVLEEVCRWLR
jgi:triacylglycerol lipase